MAEFKKLPEEITKLDVPFKISAGPGAGKTTWLVKHVQNVIKNSNRLDKTKKVACITYTRIGADTVNKKVKVETGTNRLDIGTIHSFLYRNVIKPFSFLIEKDKDDKAFFNVEEFVGIVENKINFDRFSSWRKTVCKPYYYEGKSGEKSNLDITKKCLENIVWKLVDNDIEIGLSMKYRPNYQYEKNGQKHQYVISNKDLLAYKRKCWTHGIMHYEDVLYFTHYLFIHYPKIIKFVSNKFPYLYLDEFQDTNSLQTWIVKQLSEKGTIVGVIGDPAQSIFEFAGAQRKDFNEFILPGLITYNKADNFRSARNIVNFLGQLRDDIIQQPPDEVEDGESVVVLVGEASASVNYIKELGDDDYVVLCRDNKHVNQLKYNIKNTQKEKLISLLYFTDSNNKRVRFIHSLFKAYDLFEHEEYKESIREIKKHFRIAKVDVMEKRRLSINIIEYLRENVETPIIDIYNYWQKELKTYSITMVHVNKRKDINNKKDVYKYKFNEFIPFLSKQTKVTSKIRTIHQAKGDEFNNVLLCLFDKMNDSGGISNTLENIIDDYIFKAKENIKLDSPKGEETRLVYVACSRAKKRLFINVPRLSKVDKERMEKIGVKVEAL